MSRAFITDVLQHETGLTTAAAGRATTALIKAIVAEMKRNRKFTLPSFGRFRVCKTKARTALNPRTLEPIKVKAGKTVRFRASPVLRKLV
jgi:DNA-binding protein HU-beta